MVSRFERESAPVQDQPQVAPLLRDRQVHHPAQGGFDLRQLGVQLPERGVPPDQPPALSGPPTDVGETQEGEGFGLALSQLVPGILQIL
jgi:hypothetical protein